MDWRTAAADAMPHEAPSRGVPSFEQMIKLYRLWGELPPPLQ
jgi:hypothetical protein